VTGYGAVPGYRPLPLGGGANVQRASAWHGKWADITGYVWIGNRYYSPETGTWVSFDPAWNSGDPSGFTYCGGDPINRTDPDGKCNENNLPNLATYPGITPQAAASAAWNSYSFVQELSTPMPTIDLANLPPVANNGGYSTTSIGPSPANFQGDPIWNASSGWTPGYFQSQDLTIGLGNVGPGMTANMAMFNANLYVNTLSMPILPVSAETTAMDSSMITVLGSSRDVAPYVGQPGFNTFTGAGIAPAEWDTQNALWLNNAIQNGDTIWQVTDPAAHAITMDILGKQSAYLNLEIPMLNQYTGVNVIPKYVTLP
jgi:RHS repeat-associated protein